MDRYTGISYHFDIEVNKDLTLTVNDGKLSVRFENPSTLFWLVEELGLVETGLLEALGYGRKE